MLVLKVIKGKLNRNTETFGKMDPYVAIKTKDGLEYKTKVHTKGGDAPIWNDILEVPNVLLAENLKLQCLDEDVGKDDLVGECSIVVNELCDK